MNTFSSWKPATKRKLSRIKDPSNKITEYESTEGDSEAAVSAKASLPKPKPTLTPGPPPLPSSSPPWGEGPEPEGGRKIQISKHHCA